MDVPPAVLAYRSIRGAISKGALHSPRFWLPIAAYVIGGLVVGSAILRAGCGGGAPGRLWLAALVTGIILAVLVRARGPQPAYLAYGLAVGVVAGSVILAAAIVWVIPACTFV
jgi:hypothetical protein